MVPQVTRLWATVLVIASLYKCDDAVVSENKSPAKSSCLSEVGAIFEAPSIQCQPMVACNSEELTKNYLQLHTKCQVNASQRLNEREHFLYRINYWQSDHVFLYSLIEKAHEPHHLVLDAERLTHRDTEAIPELNRKLLVHSIEAGRIEDALLLFITTKDKWTMKQLVDAVEDHPNHNVTEEVVLHLLEFARSIPSKNVRIDLYKAIMPLMQRHKHYTSYVTLLYAGDVTALFTAKQEKTEYLSKPLNAIVDRLRRELQNLELDFNVWLANKYPRYYTLYLHEIFSFDIKGWKKLEKRRLFEITSRFNAKGHRFQVIEQFLKFAKIYDARDSMLLESYLPTLTREVEKLEQTVQQTGNHKHELDRIQKIKDSFKIGFYDHKQIYRIYLNKIKLNGKFGRRHMEMEKQG